MLPVTLFLFHSIAITYVSWRWFFVLRRVFRHDVQYNGGRHLASVFMGCVDGSRSALEAGCVQTPKRNRIDSILRVSKYEFLNC